MPKRIRNAGIRHVAEISTSNRMLVEKALYMRCQSFLASVKAGLLTRTIFEVDDQRRKLRETNDRLAQALTDVEAQRERLTLEIIRREFVEKRLKRQRTLADTLHRGLTLYLLEVDFSRALELLCSEVMHLLSAKIAVVADIEGDRSQLRQALIADSCGHHLLGESIGEELDVEHLEAVFGPLRTLSESGVGSVVPGQLCASLPPTGNALFVRIVHGSESIGICIFAGLATQASDDLLTFLDPFTSCVGALMLANSLRERESAQRHLALQAIAEAEAANRSKGEFIANMSHELRTPLNAITSVCYLLSQHDLAGEIRARIGQIESAGRVLVELVDEVLDLAKSEAGKLRLVLSPFELRGVISQVVTIARAKAEAKALSFEVELSPDLPSQVVGDRMRIQQILTNLLDNAVKFTAEGYVILRVTADRSIGDDSVELCFSVEDSGIGIARERVPQLFAPFTQADASITRRFGGSGLGLALSQELVDLMDGSLSAESQLGVGSTFTVQVRVQVDPGPEGGDETPAPAVDLRGVRILAVEDNEMNQLVIRTILEDRGVDVTVVDRGAAAVQRIADGERFDAVLMDIQMPEMDGYEATRRIRELSNGANLPIIAMTAHVLSSDRARCFEAGMNEHLGKPIHVDQMVEVLGHWTAKQVMSSGEPADIGRALDQLGGDMSLFEQILARFGQDYEGVGPRLRRLFALGQLDAACDLLNDLKASLGLIGAERLETLVTLFRGRLLTHGPDAASVELELDTILRELEQLFAWIRSR